MADISKELRHEMLSCIDSLYDVKDKFRLDWLKIVSVRAMEINVFPESGIEDLKPLLLTDLVNIFSQHITELLDVVDNLSDVWKEIRKSVENGGSDNLIGVAG